MKCCYNIRYANIFCIDSIETELYLWVNWVFPYTTSNLFNSKLLSLTDATYSYKLPTDIPRIATESKGTGQNVIATTLWFNDNFSGLTPLADYYLSNTPWAISMTAGTNFYTIWSSIDANTLYVNPQDVWYWNSFVITSSNTEVTTLSTSLVKVKEILCNKSFTFNVYFEIKINSNPSICTWRIYVNWVAVWTSRTNNTSIYVWFEEYITVSKWDLIQIYMSTNNWAQTASLQNFRLRWWLIQPQWMNNVVKWAEVIELSQEDWQKLIAKTHTFDIESKELVAIPQSEPEPIPEPTEEEIKEAKLQEIEKALIRKQALVELGEDIKQIDIRLADIKREMPVVIDIEKV